MKTKQISRTTLFGFFTRRLLIGLPICILLGSPSAYALDLADVITLAQKNDAEFQIAYADYLAKLENKSQSRSALLPNIDLNVFTSNTSSETSNSTGSFTDGTSDYSASGYTLSLTQTIFNKKLFAALDQSDAEISQALANYQSAKLEMMLRVVRSYFDVLAANDNLSFAKAETKTIKRQLEQSTERFKAGLIAVTDVKESQAQYDISAAQKIAAENALASANEALYVLINITVDQLASLKQTIPLMPPEPDDINQWEQNTLKNNLDIRAATYAVTAASEATTGSQSEHLPTLNLNLTHGSESSDGSSLGSSFGGRDVEDTRLQLNLDIPIYSGGYTNSKHRENIALLDKAKATLNYQRRLSVQQTRNAYRSIRAAITQTKALKKALESTQSAAEATQVGFEIGTRNSVDVLQAQREQHRSERDYSHALYDYVINMIELKKSAGILSETDIQMINNWLDSK